VQELLCPPCGTVIRGENEEQLIEDVQAHAKQFHGHLPTREEVRSAVRPVHESGS
jgi:predicted small metal-binding protein